MTPPLKDYDEIDRERREFNKKMKEYLKKRDELKELEKKNEALVKRSSNLRALKDDLAKLKERAAEIRRCQTEVDRLEQIVVHRKRPEKDWAPDAIEGNTDLADLNTARDRLERLKEDQKEEIEKYFKEMVGRREKSPLSAEDEKEMIETFRKSGFGDLSTLNDEAALDKAIRDSEQAVEDAKPEIGRKGQRVWELEKELEELQRQLKEHARKAELPKCGVDCKFPEHGKCDNPAIENGRCWIAEHQSR